MRLNRLIWSALLIAGGVAAALVALPGEREDHTAAKRRFVAYCVKSAAYQSDRCECMASRVEDAVDRARMKHAMLSVAHFLSLQCSAKFLDVGGSIQERMKTFPRVSTICMDQYQQLHDELAAPDHEEIPAFLPDVEALKAAYSCLPAEILIDRISPE